MAKHTITIIHRTTGSTKENITHKTSKTSSTKKVSVNTVSKSNKQNVNYQKVFSSPVSKYAAGLLSIQGAKKLISSGINIATTINEASTGEALNNNNARAMTGLLLNPLDFAKEAIVFNFLQSRRVSRANESLNYQRQLTGNLAFSKNFNDGTF